MTIQTFTESVFLIGIILVLIALVLQIFLWIVDKKGILYYEHPGDTADELSSLSWFLTCVGGGMILVSPL